MFGETYELGGAANVARNLVYLKKSNCDLYGILGKDKAGEKVSELCYKENIFLKNLYGKNSTIVKQKIMAHGQQVTRLDFGETNLEKIDLINEKLLLENLSKQIEKYNAIILSDYNKGIFTENLGRGIINLANKKGICVLVDPKPQNIDYFKGCTVVSPNKKEAEEITGIKYENKEKILKQIGKTICNRIDSKYATITCGSEGVFIYSPEKWEMVKTKAKEVVNVTGAGDTFIATLSLGLSSNLDIFEAAKIANYAAGIVVEKIGTAIVSPNELIKRIKEDNSKDL